jgi:hypothetical protein
VSLDDFLEDSGEISLDTFIDTPHQEKNDILDETPMEMELTFDDDFSIVTTPDPTTQIDDTFATEEIDDFDQMFENIVDESVPLEEASSKPTTTNLEKQEFASVPRALGIYRKLREYRLRYARSGKVPVSGSAEEDFCGDCGFLRRQVTGFAF